MTLTQLNTRTTKTFTFACLYTHTHTHLTRLMQVSPCGYMTATLCQASRASDDCWVILELSGLPVWMIFCLCAALWEGSHFRKCVFSHTSLRTIYYLNPPPSQQLSSWWQLLKKRNLHCDINRNQGWGERKRDSGHVLQQRHVTLWWLNMAGVNSLSSPAEPWTEQLFKQGG